ncbi:UNVERIFIED_CONTAM: hypothetical protein FKN15_025858 [Acipenser sinensis]
MLRFIAENTAGEEKLANIQTFAGEIAQIMVENIEEKLRNKPAACQDELGRDATRLIAENTAGEEKLANIQTFAGEITQIMVENIEEKLRNKPAEEARFAVEQFIQWKEEVSTNKGWLLLKSVWLLCSVDSETVSIIITSGIPAVLLKCLYLFVAFPSNSETTEENPEHSFQEIFTQTLLKLCSDLNCVEEMVQTRELQCLIIAMTSLWDQCCSSWRRSASLVLRAISSVRALNTVKSLQEMNEENGKPVEDLLNFIAHLTLCGQAELKVAICVSNPQPPGFRFDPPLATGTTVKNLPAFRILQSAFQQSGSTYICTQILSTIKQIWTWTRANFFLLEWTLQSLSQLADSICLKPLQIHTQFFQLVEMVVFELDYIPHETLQKIQYLIKENFSTRFTMAALKCFYNLTMHTVLFNDVFSDSGLLKLLLDELRKQAKILRKAGITGNKKMVNEQDDQKELTTAMLKVVAALVLRSVKNTVLETPKGCCAFRTAGGFNGLLSVIVDMEGALCDQPAGEWATVDLDSKMDLILLTLHTITVAIHLDPSLLKVLETPKGCCAFRTAGGFNGLLSVIVDMEGALCDQPAGEWATVDLDSKMDLILLTLHTITVAIHLDPVNSHFFQTTGHYEKMAEAIGLLGCFNEEELLKSDIDLTHCRTFAEYVDIVKNSKEQIPLSLRHCLEIVTCLEQVARGALNIDYSKNVEQAPDSCEPQADGKNIHPETEEGLFSQGDQCSSRIIRSAACRTSTISSEFESRLIGESMIVHPGAICVMMTLLPKIYNQENTQLSIELQFAVTDHVQSLVKSERNRQIMCMSGLLHTLLTHCQTILNNTAHPLHLSILRIFEKLASQAIEHKLLRQFLRLRNPLKCAASKQKDVSYVRYQMDSHTTSLVTRVKGVNADAVTTGGHGTDGRGFPPSAGLSFSTWFLIGKFSSACDSHPVRLFTIVRHMSRMALHFICLSVSISAPDCSLVITTEEEAFQFLDMMEPETKHTSSAPTSVRFMCSKLLIPGQWHHLAVVIAKDMKKTCKLTVYLNGKIIGTAKMGITSRDSSTPVYLARNLAQHLSGTARTIGAALVGHYGVRTFASNTAANSFQFIGGPSVILGFVAMASDDSSMYAAMKVLLSVLSSSTGCEKEMKRINGYKFLAFLLKLKSSLLSNRIFQLILSIVGTMELGSGAAKIQNHSAFKDILCDFEVWQNAPDNLDFILLTHYVDLLKSPSDGPRNAEVMHRMNVIKKLIFQLNEPSLTCEKVNIISTIMKNLLKGYFDTKDVLRDQEEMFIALGSDWFLLFIQGHLHSTTVLLGAKLLFHFLYNPVIMEKFRGGMPTRHHVHIPQVYYLLAALFLQKPSLEVPAEKLDLDSMLQYVIENISERQKICLCEDVAIVLLELVKIILSKPTTDYKISDSTQDGKIAILVGNVAFFSKKLVEKLYAGMFVVEPEKILLFITDQIVVVLEKAYSQREQIVSILYNSLNRAILYFLSRPRQSLAEQQTLARSLKVLQDQWDIIFATYNSNVNFITCLMHCLVQIKAGSCPDGFGLKGHKKHPKGIWYHFLPKKNIQTNRKLELPYELDVQSELLKLVETTWSKLMSERRRTLEDTYKIDLLVKQGNSDSGMNISQITPLWEETASKAWQQFIASQKKKLAKVMAVHSQQGKSYPISSSLATVMRTAHKRITDSFICNMFSKEKPGENPTCSRYPYEEIQEAHYMRFLLQDTALEIFMRCGESKFLVFQNKDQIKAFKRFCSAVPSLKGKGVTEAISNMR